MKALPRESSLVRAILGEPAEWSVNDYLTAHVVDGINNLTHVFITANSKSRPPAPKPIPRPEEPQVRRAARSRPRMSTTNEVSAFFGTTINAGR